MHDLHTRINESVEYIRRFHADKPVAGIVLGSGLSSLGESLDNVIAIDGSDIPHYPKSTAPGHKGRLLFGELAGLPVCLVDGRLHRYEGHAFDTIVYPIRLMVALGIQTLVVSNAAGAVNPRYSVGDIAIIDDHINMLWGSPLRGANDDRLGTRFPDMCRPYDEELSSHALAAAASEGLNAHRGVYLALSGPTYETRAEYRMVRTLGADVVGMSTVPEVIAARHADIRVLGLSIVSNVAHDDQPDDISGDHVIDSVAQVAPAVGRIVKTVLTSQ